MKNLTPLLFILSFFLFPLLSFAQQWQVITTVDKYNYQASDANFISHTIWADSFYTQADETYFHLNRIVKDCPACDPSGQAPDLYKLINQQQFLQQRVIKRPNNTYDFIGNTSFHLQPQAPLNHSWLFDTLQNITATVISLEEKVLWGTLDSCKTIALSNGESITCSKNHGIIDFNYQNESYSLVGIDNRNLGTLVPKYSDFHSFEVGDVFQRRTTYDYFSESDVEILKTTVLNKIENDSQIVYTLRKLKWESISQGPFAPPMVSSSVFEGNTTVKKNVEGEIISRYNGQLYFDDSVGFSSECDDGQYTRVLSLSKADNNDRITFSSGQYTSPPDQSSSLDQGYLIQASSDTIIQGYCNFFNDFYVIYTTGLGLVYKKGEVIDHITTEQLVGYVKDGDTTGVITPDEQLIVSHQEVFSPEELSLSPNISRDKFYLSLQLKEASPIQLQLYNLRAQRIRNYTLPSQTRNFELDLSKELNGIYLLRAQAGNKQKTLKLVKIE